MVIHKAYAIRVGYLKLQLIARVGTGGSIGNTSLGILRYYFEQWLATNLMTKRIAQSNGQLIFLRQLGSILQAKVQLVVSHVGRIAFDK